MATRSQVPTRTVPRQVKNDDGIDQALLDKMKAQKQGGGLSTDQDDSLVPLIYLLQPLSPQCMKGDQQRIDGAEAGDIWLRDAEIPIVKGEAGMIFQPCAFYKDIVEWLPDRGGFVARHDFSCYPNTKLNKGWTGSLSDVTEEVDEDDASAWPKAIRKNGNHVVFTRYHVGYVYPEDGSPPMPYILPLSSTGHTFSRQWTGMMRRQSFPDGTPNTCAWNIMWRISTYMKQNVKGAWYMYKAEKSGWAKSHEVDLGAALHESFESNEKKINDEMMDGIQSESGTGGSEELSNDEDM